MHALSVVLLGANSGRREAVSAALAGTQARVVRQIDLPDRDTLPALLRNNCDVLIVDLNEQAERGLDLVEAACGIDPSLTVIAYARLNHPDLLLRCMRAGAREFLTDPLSPGAFTEALVRASVRLDEVRRQKKTAGRCLTFVAAKGGSGVTTIAANFAVSLANVCGEGVVLVDLDVCLGDAALDLGLSSPFSTLDALENENRLDSELVAKLLVRHSSGLQVLAAPDGYNTFQPTVSGVVRLVNILRNDFPWVVVDSGARFGAYGQSLFDISEKVYLVTQVSVAELRNSNRFIAASFKGDAIRKLAVVLNRYAPRSGEIDEESITRALTVVPAWKIPSDYQAVRSAQNSATALVMKDGPITNVLRQMARTACGKPEEKKKKFSLFG
jgi:pilus assembly protein CpaE